MADYSNNYPFICGVAGERGGMSRNPAVDPAILVTPTASFTSYMQAASVGVGFAPGGKLLHKFNGVVYAMPIYLNT